MFDSVRCLFRNLARRRRAESELDLDLEVRAYAELLEEENLMQGMSPEEARRKARIELGGHEQVKEAVRGALAGAWIETVWQDLRLGARMLRKNPGFAAAAVLTLALGIGVNTAIFTLVHAVMFNTLPVAAPNQLYRLGAGDNCCVMTGYQNGQDFALFSYELYKTLRDGTHEIRHLAAFQAAPQIVSVRRAGSSGAGDALKTEYVSSNYFDLFGIQPALGSFFTPDNESRGAAPVGVLSYRAWQAYFGGDPSTIGASLDIKGKVFTVIGIAPRSFYGETLRSDPPDCWLPATTEPLLAGANSLFNRPAKMWLYLMGRIPPGIPLRPIESKINAEARRWYFNQAGAEPTADRRRAIETQFIPLTPAAGGVETMGIAYRNGLTLLMSLSSLVLLIACANVANLLLARGASLRAQNSLKIALGASRRRMIRQALADSLILSALGGAAGLGLAFAAAKLIVLLAFRGARYVPLDAAPSAAVLAFAAAVSLATGLLFGIAPAFMATRSDPADALRGASRGSVSASGMLPQKILIVTQTVLSFVLLTGAGLLTQSLWNLQGQNFGFRTDNRVIVKLNPAVKDYPSDRLLATYRTLQDRLSHLPGVASAALAMYLPMTGNNWNSHLWREGGGDAPEPGAVSYDFVSPGYFETIGTRLLEGRAFTPSDQPHSRGVAVANQTFVARYCKGRNPIGMHFGMSGPRHADDYEIVGVVEDAKYNSTYRPAYATLFMPLFQPDLNADGSLSDNDFIGNIAIQVNGGAFSLEPLLRQTIANVDPNLGLLEVIPYQEQLALNFTKERLIATLTQLFGLLALVLAATGIYGLVSLAVNRRTAEIGIRVTLGATRGQVVRMILRGALWQVVVGVVVGVPLALAGARLIEHQLFGVAARNPFMMAGAAGLLLAFAIATALIPAARAATQDPVRALSVR